MFVNYNQRNSLVIYGGYPNRPITAYEKRENRWNQKHQNFVTCRPKTSTILKSRSLPIAVCNRYARAQPLNIFYGYESNWKDETRFRENKKYERNKVKWSKTRKCKRPYYFTEVPKVDRQVYVKTLCKSEPSRKKLFQNTKNNDGGKGNGGKRYVVNEKRKEEQMKSRKKIRQFTENERNNIKQFYYQSFSTVSKSTKSGQTPKLKPISPENHTPESIPDETTKVDLEQKGEELIKTIDVENATSPTHIDEEGHKSPKINEVDYPSITPDSPASRPTTGDYTKKSTRRRKKKKKKKKILPRPTLQNYRFGTHNDEFLYYTARDQGNDMLLYHGYVQSTILRKRRFSLIEKISKIMPFETQVSKHDIYKQANLIGSKRKLNINKLRTRSPGLYGKNDYRSFERRVLNRL